MKLFMISMCGVLWFLNVLDIWWTDIIIKVGGSEVNPWMASLFEKIGFWPSVIFFKMSFVLLLSYFVFKFIKDELTSREKILVFSGLLCLNGFYIVVILTRHIPILLYLVDEGIIT